MVDKSPLSFGQLLRQHRLAAGLTQEALADLSGLSARAVSDLEREAGRKPQQGTVERLVQALAMDSEQGAVLWTAARGLDRRSRGAPPPALAGHNLPRHLPADVTTLIGRDAEVAAVTALLQRPTVRLVTLTGVGGVGKTRVAVRVAQNVVDVFPDGVVFVPLASIRDVNLVMPTINAAIGVAAVVGQEPLDTLGDFLHTKRALLVLDNVEQVRDSAPSLIELLRRCPDLRILVTSRAMLRVRGEHIFAVHPLAIPDPTFMDSRQGVMRYASVRLFVERSQAVKPGFAVTMSNAPIITAICARLDGLPLAIELAAARVNVLAPPALLPRLERRLSVLVDGPRDAPERQQTLRHTLAWSYDLLAADEQEVFRRLAVFVGGWTLEAAAVVRGQGGNGDGALADVLARMGTLVDANLVRGSDQPDGRELRFDMLETVREYAWERLEESGEADVTRQRHLEWYIILTEQAEPHIKEGEDRATWLAQLDVEHDNVRAALLWADGHDVVDGLRLAGAFAWFWYVRGYLSEGRTWLERLLARAGASLHDNETQFARARALGGVGLLAGVQGHHAHALDALDSALSLYRGLDDRQGIAATLNSMGTIGYLQAEYTRATSWLEESLVLYRALGNNRGRTMALNNLGLAAYYQGDYFRARALFEESLALCRDLGDTWGVSRALGNLSVAALEQGDYRRASDLLEESLAACRPLGDKQTIANALNGVGYLALLLEDYERAETLLEESMGLFREIGYAVGIPIVLGNLAYTALARRELDRAATLFQSALALVQDVMREEWVAWSLAGMAAVAVERGAMERGVRISAAIDHLINKEISMPVERSVHERTIAMARASLGQGAFDAAWTAGQTLSIAQVVTEARR